MAFPEQWLKAAIEAASGCDAYPLIAQEGAALPYVVYGRSSTSREVVMSTSNVGVRPAAEFSVEIYAQTYSETKTLSDAIRQSCHNFNGTANGVTIRLSLLVEERDGDPVFFDGQDRPTFVVEQTYQVRWEE